MKKKDYIGTNIEMKNDVALYSLRKDGDEFVQRVLPIKKIRGCGRRSYSAFAAMKIHLQFMQGNCTTVQI